MRPTKLSSNVFLELPPVLNHYIEADRNLWIIGNPKRGRMSLLNRSGVFVDFESLAVQRRNLLQMLGLERGRALEYKTGFEQGRRDAARHFQSFKENGRLALQSALVYGQLHGRYIAETLGFEFDLESRTLFRDVELEASAEAVVHKMVSSDSSQCVCWATAGYFSGHISEIIGRRVVTLETQCMAQGNPKCKFISRLDSEWGEEAAWVRAALELRSVDQELAERNAMIEAAQRAARRAQVSLNNLSRRVRSELLMDQLIGESEAMAPAAARAQQLAASDAAILIVGEPGTGKSTVAKAIHYGSERKRRPFLTLDPAGMSPQMLIQEIAGFEAGSVQGAIQPYKGILARANGGTVFIKDVTELTIEAQGRILKAMEEREIVPLGADHASKADVRIVAGISEDPKQAVSRGALRESLYYALAIGRIELPPLCERESDIIRLAEAFLDEFRARHDRPDAALSPEFKEVLLNCAWPGNVRQLRNVIEHAVIMSGGDELTPAHLPDEILASRWTRQPQDLTEEVIRAALSKTHNNRSKAAALLGVGRTTLWRSMKRLNIA